MAEHDDFDFENDLDTGFGGSDNSAKGLPSSSAIDYIDNKLY